MSAAGVIASSGRRETGPFTITGNDQIYAKGVYSAYTGMWGHSLPQNDQLVAESSMLIDPATFPIGTKFTWDVDQDPDWIGVNGYLFLAYGNYDSSPGIITSRQVKNIAQLSLDVEWTFEGDEASGLLSECWLSSASAPSGSLDKTHEIAFFPKCSPDASAWLATLPTVGTGSFVSNGVTWNVAESTSATGQPYLIAYRPGYASSQGALPYKDYLAFLTASGKITGNEWFNGVAFGVEPFNGAGSLTITKFAPTYSDQPPAPPQPPVIDTFDGPTVDGTKWPAAAGTTSIVAGRLRVVTTASFPGRSTGTVLDLNSYPVWVEIPTLPNIGNGGTKVRFLLENGANAIFMAIENNPRIIWTQGTGITSALGTGSYSATNHRWLRFRISGANLLFEASPDGLTWTTLRTVAAPAWLTSGLVRATLQTYFTGTEPAPGFAEFDNFNV